MLHYFVMNSGVRRYNICILATHPTTFKHFKKEYYVSNLTRRQSHDAWVKSGKKAIHEVATQKVAERINAYERPDIPPDIEADLNKYTGLKNI